MRYDLIFNHNLLILTAAVTMENSLKTQGSNLVAAALAALLLTACAGPTTRQTSVDPALVESERIKQQEIALERRYRKNRRLTQVSYQLLTAASVLCEKEDEPLRAGIGVLARSKYSYDKEMQETAARLFDLDEIPKILYVVQGSPAEKAGIREGDRVLVVDNTPIRRDKGAFKQLASIYSERVKPGSTVTLLLENAGQRREVRVATEKQCRYVEALVDNGAVNAFADGSKVMVTTGMMRFAETDQELALVVSHEIAHNLMDHMVAKRTNAAGGMVLDILAAAAGINTGGAFSQMAGNMNSKAFEAEADYVGMYILARAGFPLEGSANFWRRMAAEQPKSIASGHSATHPATPERYVAIENAIMEIQQKRAALADLVPEYGETATLHGSPAAGGQMSILE